ncbi:hypothetical protein OZ668_15210 [Elizabethkingia sp. HX XZB]|uniref:hypothetical protein n=1 Tax=Elizabethkingia sp. HX XZB TaxID=3003193 RepID=UPI002A23A3A8|nr:hypothetical protein [Elizabethkingia sp. HX XZB]MDX8569348.1 hypothetical protein [Elizabethkingia sp. HX XZB]
MKDKTCLKKYIKPTIRVIEVKMGNGIATSSVFNYDNEKRRWGVKKHLINNKID